VKKNGNFAFVTIDKKSMECRFLKGKKAFFGDKL